MKGVGKKGPRDGAEGTWVPGLPRSQAPGLFLEALLGLATGAMLGSWTGPQGALVGALIGLAIGGGTAIVADEADALRRARDAERDVDIGVFWGDLGEASWWQPPSLLGAPSAAASGAGGGHDVTVPPSGGPMPRGDA